MIDVARHTPYFLCLCNSDRQSLLADLCAQRPYRVEFVQRIEDVLTLGLLDPPLGLILEISTSIRFGAERMSRFLNMGVSWPIMRCAVGPDGDARVMCFEPAHGEPLLKALDGIVGGDPAWVHPRFARKYLRLNIKGRVRLRTGDNDRWRLGYLHGVSAGGCFVMMTADAPPLHTAVELEMVDCEPESQLLRGEIVWQREWHASLELPGVGVEFEPSSVTQEFLAYITKSPQLSDLIADE